MRILIDTNIFIYREDNRVIPESLQRLLKVLNSLKTEIMVHPGSIEELKGDADARRREIALSKINAYPLLGSPPSPEGDEAFLECVGRPETPNDRVDNMLLYAVYKDAVDFLITEDRRAHNKAAKSGIKDRVLYIEDAQRIFEKSFPKESVSRPPALDKEFVYNLDVNDPLFDSLKEEYGKSEFEDWFRRICREGRECFVYKTPEGSMGALLIYKLEDEPITDSFPPLPRKKRLKLSTFKVSYTGFKIGELFIKLAMEYSIKNGVSEIYLTHFTKLEDELVSLMSEYGFRKVAHTITNGKEEDIYLKEVMPHRERLKALSPLEVSKDFWPNFYDGTAVSKYILPIRPEYHNRLFVECRGRQTSLAEHAGQFIIEGNTIKKAYLCHSKLKKISPGDILLFYRSQDRQELTSLGVVETVHIGLRDKDQITKLVGKRTVYSLSEIEEMAKKPTTIILFTWHFNLKNPLNLGELKKLRVLAAAPQSICKISHGRYMTVKQKGGMDERFAVD